MANKSLNDSYVFNTMNKNNIINTTILKAITEGKELHLEEDLPEANLIISRNFKFPYKLNVLEAHKSGNIVLKFSPKGIKIPTSVPFVLYQNSKKQVSVIVFVDIYCEQYADGTYKCDAKKLYTMMESALIALKFYSNERAITNSSAVISAGSEIYSNMIMRVLNKKYSLIDKNKINSLLFLASKFYMINILGLTDGEVVSNHAKKPLRNVNPMLIEEIEETFKNEDFKDISTFIQALADPTKSDLGMTDLTVRGFLESFINMYDSASVLSLEMFPYLMYNIIGVLHSAYINNQYILEDMVTGTGKGAILYNAMRNYI